MLRRQQDGADCFDQGLSAVNFVFFFFKILSTGLAHHMHSANLSIFQSLLFPPSLSLSLISSLVLCLTPPPTGARPRRGPADGELGRPRLLRHGPECAARHRERGAGRADGGSPGHPVCGPLRERPSLLRGAGGELDVRLRGSNKSTTMSTSKSNESTLL